MRKGKLWGYVGMTGGDTTTICLAEGETELPREIAELAETMALEACIAQDVPHRSVVYPYKTIHRVESEAVRISIL